MVGSRRVRALAFSLSCCSRVVAATAAVFAICPDALAAGKRTIVGTIRNHECGDNCYLTIVDAHRKEHVGLCTAPLCRAWNVQGSGQDSEMPKRFAGRKVRITVTKGIQVDGEGDPIGRFDAFSKIELLR
jgi:hypothetical protein